MADQTKHWTLNHTWGLAAILVAIFLLGWFVPAKARLWAWLPSLALLWVFVLVAGHGITGYWRGAFIDEQNRISLSRLQLAAWTVVVLSAYLIAALGNLAGGAADPLAIRIDSQIWILLGISTTSLVGSPLLKSNKKLQGLLLRYSAPGDSSWADLFRGEETGNEDLLDMGKLQLFYFTVIVVFAYAVALGTELARGGVPITEFPSLSSGVLALVGISHAGYLMNKVIPHGGSRVKTGYRAAPEP
jgi:hypothetical protein